MSQDKACLVCKKPSAEVPLTKFNYQDGKFYICPQHIPILIHHPEQLDGLLAGADKLTGG